MNGQFPEFGSGSLTCIIFPPSPLETYTHRRSFSSSAARESNVGSLNFDLDLCWATRNRRDPLRLVIFAYMQANLNAAVRSVRSAHSSDASPLESEVPDAGLWRELLLSYGALRTSLNIHL